MLLLGKLAAAAFPEMVAGMQYPAVLRTLHNARPVIIPAAAPPAVDPPYVNGNGNGANLWPMLGPDEVSLHSLMRLFIEVAKNPTLKKGVMEEANQAEIDADLLAQKGPVRSRRVAALLLTGLDNGFGYERGDAALDVLARRGSEWAAALIGSTTTDLYAA